MTRLGTLLSSTARTEILRVLWYQPEPVGLRSLARIAGVLPRSAELALHALVDEVRVKQTRDPSGPCYALNRCHPDVELLEAVILAASRATTISRSRMLKRRAAQIVPFISESGRMMKMARRVHHVT